MNETNGSFTFIQAGMMTSIQDLGRIQHGKYGMPYSGAMDQLSFRQANYLLQNQEGMACLEMTKIGPELKFDSKTYIVFTGAAAEITHNDRIVPLGKILEINSGDYVKVGKFINGQWLYMGIKGGLIGEVIAGSRSWYPRITIQDKFNSGDNMEYVKMTRPLPSQNALTKITYPWTTSENLTVYPGSEWEKLDISTKQKLLSETFTISYHQNRMGIHLVESLDNGLDEILTAPVYPGTIQLTPSGKIIVLMRDAQVTGGYARILHIAEKSLNDLAQKLPNQKIRIILN